MFATRSPRPVSVLVGLGFPIRIGNAHEALEWLEAEPAAVRDEAYDATCAACRDAVTGTEGVEIETGEALDVVTAYARRRGILLEDDAPGVLNPEHAARLCA
jgi:hypothetical protein